MPTKIALLRAVNIAGKNLVAMPKLRAMLESLGFTDVKTLLQSGNAVFRSGRSNNATLEKKIERAIEQEFGLAIDVFVLSDDELAAVCTQNPFRDEAAKDPGRLVAMFLKHAPTKAAVESLRGAIVGRERIHAVGRVLYIVYTDGIGRSKLTNLLIEKRLAARRQAILGTGRNWNTIRKLQAIADDFA